MEIKITEKQAHLIIKALDFYSRIGIGQFGEIKNHPTFEKIMYERCTPKKVPEVGDKTPQGKVVEIKNGKALISGSVKNGKWDEEFEWKKLEDVKLSTDYSKFHAIRDAVDSALIQPRNMLMDDTTMDLNGSFGIHNKNVDESCRESFDIIQDIRHHFWKKNPDKSFSTVDSSVLYSSKNHKKIEIKD